MAERGCRRARHPDLVAEQANSAPAELVLEQELDLRAVEPAADLGADVLGDLIDVMMTVRLGRDAVEQRRKLDDLTI
jgi:hypothetical protein